MGKVTVLDGGTGRELARIGAPFSQPLWSAQALLEGPDYVRRVHESYVAAGAEVITTNSYALVPFHLGQELYDREGRRLTMLAASIAREVANRHPGVLVAGCLPPVLGSYRPDLFVPELARPILEVLVREQAPFVDLWLAETQSSIAEAAFVREVLDLHRLAAPLWISFTLDDVGDVEQPRLRSGESVLDAARAAERLGAEVLLFNCSQPEVMEPAVAAARGATELPIGVYANSFVTEIDESAANAGMHDIRDDVTAATYLEFARRWVDAGASLVGGCCGIGPEHISALSADLSAS